MPTPHQVTNNAAPRLTPVLAEPNRTRDMVDHVLTGVQSTVIGLRYLLIVVALVLTGCRPTQPDAVPPTAEDPTIWEGAIQAFEAEDEASAPPDDAIVFVGSSSIRLWTSLADDMAPLTIIRRGFGGSKLGDVIHYVDRLVLKYEPKAVVIFAGTNDIAGDTPKQPDVVFGLYKQFVTRVHAAQPDVPIYFIAITPSWARSQHFELVRETNELVKTYSATDDRLRFLDTAAAVVDAEGKPRPELFVGDKLHLNADGYAAWTSVVRPILMRDWGE